jgi:hypothetical protein
MLKVGENYEELVRKLDGDALTSSSQCFLMFKVKRAMSSDPAHKLKFYKNWM